MYRLFALLAAASLPIATGCVVRTYNPPPRYVVTEYRYYGEHPLPGGGWCHLGGVHLHPFAPEYQYYAYADGYYRYSGPIVVWYYDYHPLPGGGYCPLHGRHAHNFAPGAAYASAYYWDAGRSSYVYNGGGYHGATAAPGAPGYYHPSASQHPAQPAPPPGATYTPPPPPAHPPPASYPPPGASPKPGSPSARGNDPGRGVADPPRPDPSAAPSTPPPGNPPAAPAPSSGEQRNRKIENEHTERAHPNE